MKQRAHLKQAGNSQPVFQECVDSHSTESNSNEIVVKVWNSKSKPLSLHIKFENGWCRCISLPSLLPFTQFSLLSVWGLQEVLGQAATPALQVYITAATDRWAITWKIAGITSAVTYWAPHPPDPTPLEICSRDAALWLTLIRPWDFWGNVLAVNLCVAMATVQKKKTTFKLTAKFPSGVWDENVIDLWCLHGRKEGDTTPILDSVSNMLQYSQRRANKWHVRLWLHRHFPWAGFPLQTNSLCKNYITHIVSQMILKVFFFLTVH